MADNYIHLLLTALAIYEKDGYIPRLDYSNMRKYEMEILDDYCFCIDKGISYDEFVKTVNLGYSNATNRDVARIIDKYRKEK